MLRLADAEGGEGSAASIGESARPLFATGGLLITDTNTDSNTNTNTNANTDSKQIQTQ